MKKLLDSKGETLVETLAAILIFTLASIILYSMVTSAASVNKKARQKDVVIHEQMEFAEHADNAAGTGTVTMTMEIRNGTSTETKEIAKADVNIFKSAADDSLYSYMKADSAATEGGTTP